MNDTVSRNTGRGHLSVIMTAFIIGVFVRWWSVAAAVSVKAAGRSSDCLEESIGANRF